MGGHPEGEVASQLALQTSRRCSSARRKPDAATTPLRFLHDVDHRRRTTRSALRHREGADRHAAHHAWSPAVLQGNAAYWVHCGDSRLYVVRGDKLIARTRDHSYSELQETLTPGRADGRALQPQRAVHLPGQPRQAGGRHRRPAAAAAAATASCCAPTACGAAWTTARSPSSCAGQPVSDAVPELVEQALRNGGAQERQRHGARGRVGSRRGQRQPAAASRPTALGDGGVRLHHPGQRASDSEPDELDEAEIERSIAEINEAIRRSAARKGLSAFAIRLFLPSPHD